MFRTAKGNLFVVSAPSGAGKTTLCRKLTELMPDLRHSVSYTTRTPRSGEQDGKDYIFVGEGEFRRMIEEDEFVEWAEVHGNLYGTSRSILEGIREQGADVILDIDVQGARQLRSKYRNGVHIFILPPSLDVLRKRLEGRMSNSAEDMDRRMRRAVEEIKEYNNYDYVIVNDIFERAVEELKAIVTAERVRTDRLNPEWINRFAR